MTEIKRPNIYSFKNLQLIIKISFIKLNKKSIEKFKNYPVFKLVVKY